MSTAYCSSGSKSTTGGSPIACCIPYVNRFSTAVESCRDQITRTVCLEIQRRCQCIPSGGAVVSETTHSESFSTTIVLRVQAWSINSVDVALRNVGFEIVGLASAIVRVSGEAVVTTEFTGIDAQRHRQTDVAAFSYTEAIQGDFPANTIAEGSLSLVNLVIVNEIDPSTLTITGETLTLFLTDTIRLIVPAET